MGYTITRCSSTYLVRSAVDLRWVSPQCMSRMMMPKIMAASFLSDCALWLNLSIILESRHNFAYVWQVIDDEQPILHDVAPGRWSTLGSSGDFDSSGPLYAVQSCSFC